MNGACHCGAVRVTVPGRPELLNQCNCSVCWTLGTLWGYYALADVTIDGPTRAYRRGDVAEPTLAFPFCETCGATIAWTDLRGGEDARIAVNMRLFDPAALKGVEQVFGDGRNHVKGGPRRTYRAAAPFDGAGAKE